MLESSNYLKKKKKSIWLACLISVSKEAEFDIHRITEWLGLEGTLKKI